MDDSRYVREAARFIAELERIHEEVEVRPEDAPEVGYDRIFRPPLPAKPKPQKGQ